MLSISVHVPCAISGDQRMTVTDERRRLICNLSPLREAILLIWPDIMGGNDADATDTVEEVTIYLIAHFPNILLEWMKIGAET